MLGKYSNIIKLQKIFPEHEKIGNFCQMLYKNLNYYLDQINF